MWLRQGTRLRKKILGPFGKQDTLTELEKFQEEDEDICEKVQYFIFLPSPFEFSPGRWSSPSILASGVETSPMPTVQPNIVEGLLKETRNTQMEKNLLPQLLGPNQPSLTINHPSAEWEESPTINHPSAEWEESLTINHPSAEWKESPTINHPSAEWEDFLLSQGQPPQSPSSSSPSL
ncbi:unnamed protein product [Mytilus coruscus]|uniref:Uncharacterized protein n=1 Tax=Mytilus coruscus TaxID=42192 RepID=A0A6J8DLM1_MYTCO|nr:unnamed protein product [Mytilus coruscus]